MADKRSSPRRPDDSAFEETLRRRLGETLDGVEGPDPTWATSRARSEVEPVGARGFPVWRSLAALAATLLIVFAGLTAISLPGGMSSAAATATGHPAASQAGAPSAAASAQATPAPSFAASASGAPSATPTATLGPCPSLPDRTPDPLMCLTCRCGTPLPSPTPGG